ncbi:MAG: domain protein putative component of TonB system, partial [Labilithrix sp.]|nr:domain protein putative component of TonB system [Labilithrix sp.]
RPPAGPPVERDAASAVALRLAIGKDGLGIELARPATFGCLDVVELVVRLPNVRFPFDVTGGVARFRHRRGELERIAVELDSRRAARWAEPLLRGLIGAGRCTVSIAPRAFGATVTLMALDPSSPTGRSSAPRALAFEVALVGTPELALVVHSARGANLPAPATVLAMRAMATLLGDVAKREGARFVVARAAARIARALLPDAGVRAPGGDDVVLAGSGESDGVLFVAFTRGPTAPPVPQAATLAHEAALLARSGDDARFGGDFQRARHHDVATLERAPRHAEIGRRIAEVDAHVGGRAEAAVATLRAADRPPYLGQLLGDLLVEAGDVPGAIAALLREGERDPSALVAALCHARAAGLATDPVDALAWLDAAIARAPALAELRWERASRRLVHGRLADARADFQELEAIATGAAERYEVLRRAADIHRAHGLGADAALLYERALLYRPDDPDTVAGLGAAIATEGRAARGATLLARAIELAGAQMPPLPTAWMELELARVLGDHLGDRPAAVARLRAIPDEAHEAIAARGLEGRYRAALGDTAGAALAFARLRERAGHEVSALPWLDEAARFEEARGELQLAQAHIAAALAIAPRRVEIESRYRALSEQIAELAGLRAPRPEVHITVARGRETLQAPPDPAELRERVTMQAPPESASALVSPGGEAPAIPSPEEDEERIEALTRTLQGDPNNDAVVDELTIRLTRLGRSMELLALLSARLEDAPPDRREALLPQHRAVLERLEQEARAAGRDAEADLFRMARDAS